MADGGSGDEPPGEAAEGGGELFVVEEVGVVPDEVHLPLGPGGAAQGRGLSAGVISDVLTSHLYTVGPSASGDMVVEDPPPADAERAIAENTLPPGPFPGSVMIEVPGHGVAILPTNPESRARLLRGEL